MPFLIDKGLNTGKATAVWLGASIECRANRMW